MRQSLLSWVLASCCLFAISACSHGNPIEKGPDAASITASGPMIDPSITTMGGESLAAVYRLDIDPITLSATVTLEGGRALQATQGDLYDLDGIAFMEDAAAAGGAGMFRIFKVENLNADNDLRITFHHSHPFKSNIPSGTFSQTQRTDLGYTGRALFLADLTSVDTDHQFFGNTIWANTEAIKDPDGYLHPEDFGDTDVWAIGESSWNENFIPEATPKTNTWPYKLLADDGEGTGNRTKTVGGTAVSNGSDPRGNYTPADAGWSQTQGDAEDWTGFDFVHQGQTISNSFEISGPWMASVSSSLLQLRVAILLKYCDPRNSGSVSLQRFPDGTPDESEFAYRLPHAALDCSLIEIDEANSDLETDNDTGGSPANTGTLEFFVRDWDSHAAEHGDLDLSDESDVTKVQPGAGLTTGGYPEFDVSIPALGVSTSGDAMDDEDNNNSNPTGPDNRLEPNSTYTFDANAAASEGRHPGLVRVTDPENAILGSGSGHYWVDPADSTTTDDTVAAGIQTFQAFHVDVIDACLTDHSSLLDDGVFAAWGSSTLMSTSTPSSLTSTCDTTASFTFVGALPGSVGLRWSFSGATEEAVYTTGLGVTTLSNVALGNWGSDYAAAYVLTLSTYTASCDPGELPGFATYIFSTDEATDPSFSQFAEGGAATADAFMPLAMAEVPSAGSSYDGYFNVIWRDDNGDLQHSVWDDTQTYVTTILVDNVNCSHLELVASGSNVEGLLATGRRISDGALLFWTFEYGGGGVWNAASGPLATGVLGTHSTFITPGNQVGVICSTTANLVFFEDATPNYAAPDPADFTGPATVDSGRTFMNPSALFDGSSRYLVSYRDTQLNGLRFRMEGELAHQIEGDVSGPPIAIESSLAMLEIGSDDLPAIAYTVGSQNGSSIHYVQANDEEPNIAGHWDGPIVIREATGTTSFEQPQLVFFNNGPALFYTEISGIGTSEIADVFVLRSCSEGISSLQTLTRSLVSDGTDDSGRFMRAIPSGSRAAASYLNVDDTLPELAWSTSVF